MCFWSLLNLLLMAGLVGFGVYLFVVRAPRQSTKQQAEDGIRMSEPIPRNDV